MTQKPQNPITKAHLEGVEKFKKQYIVSNDSVFLRDVVRYDMTVEEFKSFLTTYGINLLKAAKEAGPEEKPDCDCMTDYCYCEHMGHNDCLSTFHSAIDEGIEGIKKGDV